MNKYLIAVVVIVFLVDLAFQFYTNKKTRGSKSGVMGCPYCKEEWTFEFCTFWRR